MKKTQYTEAELNEINAIQEERSITRKSAIRIFEKGNRRIILTAAKTKAAPVVSAPAANPMPIMVAANADVKALQKKLKPGTPVMVVPPDVKMRAANDDTAAEPAKVTAPTTPATPAPSAAGDARKEGIRLFQLAGKPKKEDFLHVYGPQGAKWTWVARAKAVGLNTAEEAAREFQVMRSHTAQSHVIKAEPQPEKK